MTAATLSREESIDDIVAGNAFRDTLVPRADRGDSFSPAWSGWALMEAFLAGAAYARLAAKTGDEGVREGLSAMIEEFGGREHADCSCAACLIVRKARNALTTGEQKQSTTLQDVKER